MIGSHRLNERSRWINSHRLDEVDREGWRQNDGGQCLELCLCVSMKEHHNLREGNQSRRECTFVCNVLLMVVMMKHETNYHLMFWHKNENYDY